MLGTIYYTKPCQALGARNNLKHGAQPQRATKPCTENNNAAKRLLLRAQRGRQYADAKTRPPRAAFVGRDLRHTLYLAYPCPTPHSCDFCARRVRSFVRSHDSSLQYNSHTRAHKRKNETYNNKNHILQTRTTKSTEPPVSAMKRQIALRAQRGNSREERDRHTLLYCRSRPGATVLYIPAERRLSLHISSPPTRVDNKTDWREKQKKKKTVLLL